MLKTDVFKHFEKSSDVARLLGVSDAAVCKWNRIVPHGSATELERLTAGAIKVRPDLYVFERGRWVAKRKADRSVRAE